MKDGKQKDAAGDWGASGSPDFCGCLRAATAFVEPHHPNGHQFGHEFLQRNQNWQPAHW